ncbi:MAG: YicC family protein, partial [Flavobacteriaceae bacterium]|nr:YicC family protein [Flavobacteriaceae bacterium]
MIRSMTGYGKTILQLPNKKLTIEIKSLNSKNLDLNTRMPSIYREKELEIRKMIAREMRRGKVDFNLYLETTGEATTSGVNKNMVLAYMEQLRDLADADDVDLLQMAVRMPDAVVTDRDDIDEEEWHSIKGEIHKALESIQDYRVQEGKALEEDFKFRIKNISSLLEEVILIDPERIEAVRERIRRGIAELKEKIDENRFEQELIYYIEKFDITEEKVRLRNHLDYFVTSLDSTDSNGKKLGFISQEIGREINTIGSKSNYAP